MNDIELELDSTGKGLFSIKEGNENVAEMRISIAGENLTVFHTEVSDKLQGKGVAKNLLNHMVAYARKEQKKVIALCQYVRTQFMRHPEDYKDIWKQDWHK